MITETHDFTFPDTYPLERLGPLEDLLFFDIETTGFSGDRSRLYLIGCVFFRGGSWHLTQWFADTEESEQEILETFIEFTGDYSLLIHFNGDQFDIPFLQKRCQAYGLIWDLSGFSSVDIYKKIRPYRKVLGLDSLKQKALEIFLGVFRQDKYSGGELIKVYQDYLVSRQDRLYRLLMLHNREDLEGMPLILPVLSYPDFLEGNFSLTGQQTVTLTDIFGEPDLSLRLTLESPAGLPVDISWHTSRGFFDAGDHGLTVTVPLVEGTLKHFYLDYKDYYYLVYEDMAVHKSVGEYVEKEARRKATAKTCYTRQTSRFLLQPEGLWEPVFQKEYKDRRQYVPYDPRLFEDPAKVAAYLSWIMKEK